ncbi:MAG: type II/IV secretion system protein [Parcubacteria group bacterium]|nr:type II/IV secretion system protein [Parcubacteria group bacterium]
MATAEEKNYLEEMLRQQILANAEKSSAIADIGAIRSLTGSTPVTEIVDRLIETAMKVRVSDIHFDPTEYHLIIRYRIDGILYDVLLLPVRLLVVIITRLKVLANLRTDEHASAQDGRIQRQFGTQTIDIRLSIMPAYYGENAVMRLLVSGAQSLKLLDLGFREQDMEKINAAIRLPYGMILTTGPTGSGKTTTLYAMINEINKREMSIITIEDPIEFSIPGITQIPVNVQTGLTFAKGLRSIVRQDPDIMMVGEIRDSETAGIAVNSAMTGHLVLSTLHTNDAAVTLPRLLDMEVEAFLIASTVNLAIGQRLVRKLCQSCKAPHEVTNPEKLAFASFVDEKWLDAHKFHEPVGCNDCNNKGYKGRVGIFEIMPMSEKIRHAIMQNSNAQLIRSIAIEEGMTTMLQDGLVKAASGITSLQEILRVFHE